METDIIRLIFSLTALAIVVLIYRNPIEVQDDE